MNKNIINFVATLVLAIILSQFLPWWSIMLSAFITALFISLERAVVFIVPFLAISVLWIAHSFWLGNANDFILAKKIAVLLPLKGSITLLILITGIIGGLSAGVAAIFGKQCSKLFGK